MKTEFLDKRLETLEQLNLLMDLDPEEERELLELRQIKQLIPLLSVSKCPNSNCDNEGTLAVQTYPDGEWAPEPCEWCYNKKKLLNNLDLKKELEVTNKLLDERQKVLDAIPEFQSHGKCVPHAIKWIEESKSLRK
jgi:hypothetical protein